MSERLFPSARLFRTGLFAAIALCLIELVSLSVLYKHILDFTCRDNGIEGFCNFFGGFVTSALCVFAALILFAMLARSELQTLVSQAGQKAAPLWLNGAGVLLLILPLFILSDGLGLSAVVATGLLWSVGSVLAATGILLFVAPWPLWRDFFARNGTVFVPLVVLGALTPVLSNLLQPIWNVESITAVTFDIVVRVTAWFGYTVEAYPDTRIIGAGEFFIVVSHLCSGIEGIALVTIFIAAYVFLFRDQLRFPAAFLLFPIGVIASGVLNIVRIVVLLIVGLNGNPALAVGGFHSHAGWLMFTLVAIGIVTLSHNMASLRARPGGAVGTRRSAPPILRDPVVARILPFLVLMATAVVFSTISQNPSELYLFRFLIVGLALLAFLPVYRNLDWSFSAPPILLGVAIAALWVLVPHEADADAQAPFGAMTGGALAIWLIARGLGTSIVIPVVEELFFRDYLMSRLTIARLPFATAIAIIASSALFALLHDRWAEAFIAGVLFALLYLRTGRITDAIIAHGVANALIFAFAFATWNFHLI